MSDIKKLIDSVRAFRDARDWKQFHNPKDLAIGLALEAAEVLEHFHWQSKEEMEEYVKTHREEIGEELSDVLYYVLIFSDDLGIDIVDAFNKKMVKNALKYPVQKAKGRHEKYDKL